MSTFEMNRTLRVIGQCYLPNVGYDRLSNGSFWKGPGIWRILDMNSYFSDFEIVSNLTPSNETYYSVQTVHDNRADIILSFFGMTHARHQFINFPYATDYAFTFIISKASSGVSGEILEGVFDQWSYLLSLMALFMLTAIIIASNLLLSRSKNPRVLGNYLSNICFCCLSHITSQGFPSSFSAPGFGGEISWAILMLFCLTFELMHSSIFISKLMAKVNWQKIDNLQDLEKFPDVKILLREESYVDHALNQLHNWNKFESRVVYTGEFNVDYVELLTKIREGTHVMIEDGYNFQEILKLVNVNVSSKFLPSEFQMSAEPIFSLPSSFPMRKGLVHAEEINRRFMWMDAFGLTDQYVSNINFLSKGIFSPVKMDEECKFTKDMLIKPQSLYAGLRNAQPVERLGWKHFRIIFSYLIVGLALSCFVFIMELKFS